MKWSQQQREIFDWFRNESGNLVVRARAGTGKTTTIIEAISEAKEDKILLAAFNKSIAEELQSRLANPRAEAKTLHSVGFSALLRSWYGVKVESARAERLARQAAGTTAPDHVITLIKKLASLGKNMIPLNPTTEKMVDIAEAFDLISEDDYQWTTVVIAGLAIKAMQLALIKDGAVDFDDMVYVPLANGWITSRYGMVVIDEAQDMNAAQIALCMKICKKGGRIVVVGDDRQCHPAGTMIEITGGKKIPIENVTKGMQVVSYHDCFRGISYQGRKVLEVSSRPYNGKMLTIYAGNEKAHVTPNHKIPTRIRIGKKQLWAVYVMEYGKTSRLGCCKLMYKTSFGLAARRNHEGADRAWILKVFSSEKDARIFETLTSLKYGLPEQIFCEKGKMKHELLTAIGDNSKQTIECLSKFGREYSYPLVVKHNGAHIGKYMYITQVCNLIDDVNEVRTFDGTRDGGSWEIVKIEATEFNKKVYSLNVEPTEGGHRLYIADKVLVHNSIYGFRGADTGSLDRLKKELNAYELPLTVTYRCPKDIVEMAARLVPDYEAHSSAEKGEILDKSLTHLYKDAQEGDFILSRKNAPLTEIALRLLKEGKRAIIKGKDIGAGLIALTKRIKAKSVPQFLEKLANHEEKHSTRLNSSKKNAEEKVSLFRDQCDTLRSLAIGLVSVEEIKVRIEKLFSDIDHKNFKNTIVCSSIHKIKGLETDRVWILAYTLRPDSFNMEEQNIAYVAYTRSKKSLFLVQP